MSLDLAPCLSGLRTLELQDTMLRARMLSNVWQRCSPFFGLAIVQASRLYIEQLHLAAEMLSSLSCLHCEKHARGGCQPNFEACPLLPGHNPLDACDKMQNETSPNSQAAKLYALRDV